MSAPLDIDRSRVQTRLAPHLASHLLQLMAAVTAPLAHSLYLCPGLHGKGSTYVRSQPFADLLGPVSSSCIFIPPFQRRYCWNERQLVKFWTDIQAASKYKQHSGT